MNGRMRSSKGDDVSDVYPEPVDPAFWRRPLSDRMARFAELREIAKFVPTTFVNPIAGFELSRSRRVTTIPVQRNVTCFAVLFTGCRRRSNTEHLTPVENCAVHLLAR